MNNPVFFRPGCEKSIEPLILVLACSFRFFAALDARALIIFLLAKISQNTGFCTAAFETLKCAV